MGKFLGSFGTKAAHSGLQFACLTTCCRPEQRSELLNRKRGDNNEINPNSRALLPPANEVWGNVIFLHLSVILFTGGGGWHPSMPCMGGLQAHTRRRSWGIWPGGSPGSHPGGGCVSQQALRQTPPWMATGQYACYWNAFLFLLSLEKIFLWGRAVNLDFINGAKYSKRIKKLKSYI